MKLSTNTIWNTALVKTLATLAVAALASGMANAQDTKVVIVCDGTPQAAVRIEQVLFNDPATGVMRHADAGYDIAKASARDNHLNLPMLG